MGFRSIRFTLAQCGWKRDLKVPPARYSETPCRLNGLAVVFRSRKDDENQMWGGQSWPQPPFQAASRLKAGCGHDCPPHVVPHLFATAVSHFSGLRV